MVALSVLRSRDRDTDGASRPRDIAASSLKTASLGSGLAWKHDRVVIACPECGSIRLIPLSFTPYRREDRYKDRADRPARPVMKCVSCGERICPSTKFPEMPPSHWS